MVLLSISDLRLAPTRRYFGSGDENDYVVMEGSRVIGRISLTAQAPEGLPWSWTITAFDFPASVYNKGYSATRSDAMADFKARWLTDARQDRSRPMNDVP